MRPPNNINTSRPIQISVDGRDSYIQVDTGGYNLTNDGIECNDPDTSIFIPWKYIQWIEQSTAVDTVFNRQTTHNNTGSSTNPTVTNPASIVDSRDDEIRLLERNNPFARIDMKLFKQCVNNHIIEHDENGWKIRISNQRIGHNENQAMSIIRSNPSLQVYLTQSLSTITLSDTDENHASTNANMNSVNNASMNQVNSDNKEQSDYTNDPWITIDDDTANDDGMQTLLTVDPQADNEYMLDDYDDNMSYTPEMLIESYNDDTHSNTTSTVSNDNSDNTAANSYSKTASTMNSKTVNSASAVNNTSTNSDDAGAGDSTTASMSNKPTTTRHREQSYAPTEPGFSFGFTTNNKNTTTNANSASMGSHDSHEISDVNYKNNNLNRIITVNNNGHMTAAHMPNAANSASNASTVNTYADTSKLVSGMNGELSASNGMHDNSDTASMQPSSMMNTTSHVNNSSDYANNLDSIDNNATSPIHPSRKKKNQVKHHLTDYEVDDSSNTDNATTADENGCDWVVLMVALGYAGTIVSRWRSRAEAEADRDARIENNNVNSSMIPLNYMVFRANGNRLYDRKYIPRDKNGIPLKGYNEYGEYVAGLPGYEF